MKDIKQRQRQDRQDKKMRVMICLFFLKKHKRKRFVDIKKFNTNKQAIA